MLRILKYNLDDVKVPLRITGFIRFLDIHIQQGNPVIWALVDLENPKVTQIQFHGYLTGYPENIDPKSEYLGTLMFDNGSFVKHYFAAYA